MNEKEEKLVGRVMNDVLGMGLSKYNTLFLTQLTLRRYKVKNNKKPESLDVSVRKVMRRMPELCRKTENLKHKNIVETSSAKCLLKLEEELSASDAISDKLLLGDIVENVLDFLLEESQNEED